MKLCKWFLADEVLTARSISASFSSFSRQGGKHVFKKTVVTLMVGALCIAGATSSKAISFTLFNDNTPPPANDWQVGASTNSGAAFTNFFVPDGLGGPVFYSEPTVIKFGDTNTIGPASGTGTFTNVPVEFTFDISGGSVAAPDGTNQHFIASGLLNGDVGFSGGSPFSTTHVTFTKLEDTTAGVSTTTTVINPNNGLASLLISNVGSLGLDVYLNDVQDISAPGTQTLSISGFVVATPPNVPEPGSLAMLLGASVSGSLLLLKRRKRS